MDQQLLLATGGYDHSIRIWTAHNGNCVKTLAYHESSVSLKLLCFQKFIFRFPASKRSRSHSRQEDDRCLWVSMPSLV